MSQSSPLLLFKVANILGFYHETISKILKSLISSTFQELLDGTFKLLYERLNQQATFLLGCDEIPNKDLLPTPSFHNSCQELKEILISQEFNLIESTQQNREILKLTLAILDPLKQSLFKTSEKLEIPKRHVYIVNCLISIQNVLNLVSFTMEMIHQLETEIDSQVDYLVQEHYSSILKQSGLASLLEHVKYNKKAQVCSLIYLNYLLTFF